MVAALGGRPIGRWFMPGESGAEMPMTGICAVRAGIRLQSSPMTEARADVAEARGGQRLLAQSRRPVLAGDPPGPAVLPRSTRAPGDTEAKGDAAAS